MALLFGDGVKVKKHFKIKLPIESDMPLVKKIKPNGFKYLTLLYLLSSNKIKGAKYFSPFSGASHTQYIRLGEFIRSETVRFFNDFWC